MAIRFDFSGKRVLVTGASQGIGEAIARSFAEAGADTIMLAEDEAIFATAERLREQTGGTVQPLHCDIADEAAVRRALASIDRLDVLINNAGYQPRTPVADCSPEAILAFRRVLDVNVLGTWLVTGQAVARMGAGGAIVMTSSIWGKTGAATYAGYAASKHAVIGMMRSLAIELGPRDITVNCVCPGWVQTEGAMWTVRETAALEGRTPDEVIDDALRLQPIPGMMQPRDVTAMFLFLASEAARDITGQAVNVDRGNFIG